jgi:hypothetical protein
MPLFPPPRWGRIKVGVKKWMEIQLVILPPPLYPLPPGKGKWSFWMDTIDFSVPLGLGLAQNKNND